MDREWDKEQGGQWEGEGGGGSLVEVRSFICGMKEFHSVACHVDVKAGPHSNAQHTS